MLTADGAPPRPDRSKQILLHLVAFPHELVKTTADLIIGANAALARGGIGKKQNAQESDDQQPRNARHFDSIGH